MLIFVCICTGLFLLPVQAVLSCSNSCVIIALVGLTLFLHVLPTHQLLFIPMFTTFYFFPPARKITQFGCRMNFMSMNLNSYEFHTSWCMSCHSSCTGRINYCCWMCCIYHALVQVYAVRPAFWNILFYRNKYDDYSEIKIFLLL